VIKRVLGRYREAQLFADVYRNQRTTKTVGSSLPYRSMTWTWYVDGRRKALDKKCRGGSVFLGLGIFVRNRRNSMNLPNLSRDSSAIFLALTSSLARILVDRALHVRNAGMNIRNRSAGLTLVALMLTSSLPAGVTADNFSFTVAGTNADAIIRITEECYDCTGSEVLSLLEQRAVNARFDFEFIVLDRARSSIRRFQLFYAPGGVPFVQPEGPEKDLLTGSIPEDATPIRAGIADFLVYEPDPTTAEIDAFLAFKRLVEEIYGIVGPTPPGTQNTTFEAQIPPGAMDRIDSAFDLESNGDELDVGLWLTNNHTFTLFWQTALESITNTFGFRLIVQFKVLVLVQFADGSSGMWGLNDRGELDLVEGSLRDSDGNPIPQSGNEVSSGSGFEFSGDAPGERNLERFIERMRIFGIPVERDTSGTCNTRCRVAAGRFRCTPEC
jgi:hypothetical protein